jgi:hypothetical protein
MRKVVRFVEDDEPRVAGDFGDNGEQTIEDIRSGATIVVGMVVYDEDAITDLTTLDDMFESRVAGALLDSLWGIDVPYAAINDCDRDYYADTVDTIQSEYLRELATNVLKGDPA